jgi:hypothetical protein
MKKLLLIIIACFSINNLIEAVHSNDPENVGCNNYTSSFKTDGLQYSRLYQSLYEGDFLNVSFTRDDTKFSVLVNEYLNAYAKTSGACLPKNKVEIMTQECATERVTTNGWGTETGRECVRWITVGTGLYAKPYLYEGKLVLDNIQNNNAVRNTWRLLLNQNGQGELGGLVAFHGAVQNDMILLISQNGCRSMALKRFEQNLRRFALNELPFRGGGQKEEDPYSNLLVSNQNFEALINDLVSAQSRTWALNRYTYNSISSVKVVSQDEKNRPKELMANYSFQGMGGYTTGWVKVTFKNGLPECLYFYDNPSACRSTDKQVTKKYVKGVYRK